MDDVEVPPSNSIARSAAETHTLPDLLSESSDSSIDSIPIDQTDFTSPDGVSSTEPVSNPIIVQSSSEYFPSFNESDTTDDTFTSVYDPLDLATDAHGLAD
ncbi:uncharacterized protein J8A68_003233 [[Candida] subhashii]|uniref:Uncharacterized protein n=1 Tax=[Candida] subhashii TaxID=561895 RepID=A0A8J5QMU4_9ASCO|nr:uncharacterized protein J8A68_003233 [[Candida] subhashii]KAG7663233.1 hypothetical protein J8A68_003233 [[Candida] subhashii]